MKPVRKIKPTRRSLSGVYSFRGLKSIPFESSLERDFIKLQEFNLFVSDVHAQPIQIKFIKNGTNYPYTYDFLVEYIDTSPSVEKQKSLLVEVKPIEQIREYWKEWKSKFKQARQYATSNSYAFRLYDEGRIRTQALKNISFLERYKRIEISAEQKQTILDEVNKTGSVPLQYLISIFDMGQTQTIDVRHIWHLLYFRELDCDITIPLGMGTKLWVPDYGYKYQRGATSSKR